MKKAELRPLDPEVVSEQIYDPTRYQEVCSMPNRSTRCIKCLNGILYLVARAKIDSLDTSRI